MPQSTSINEESKQVTFNPGEYPQLQGIEVGSKISGKWSGTVSEVAEDGTVTVNYESTEIETENHADKALKGMKKREDLEPMDSEDDDDY